MFDRLEGWLLGQVVSYWELLKVKKGKTESSQIAYCAATKHLRDGKNYSKAVNEY